MKRTGIAVAFTLIWGAPAFVAAQAWSSSAGASDYQTFCASCHGAAGKGDGVIATSLSRRPSDLTQLANKNDGVYPAAKVFETIDTGAKVHGGSADMPEWSTVFAKSSESEGPDLVKARIDALVRYLGTIQDKR
jgi:mono/diheme cytochrome c family protein